MSSSKKRASVTENNPLIGFESTEPINSPTEATVQSGPQPKRKKPVRAGHRQTTVILPNEQLRWLAETSLGSTRDDGIVTNKTAIIKALIDVAMTASLDLSGIQSEGEIRERFLESIDK